MNLGLMRVLDSKSWCGNVVDVTSAVVAAIVTGRRLNSVGMCLAGRRVVKNFRPCRNMSCGSLDPVGSCVLRVGG
jgi:hypothetical protein